MVIKKSPRNAGSLSYKLEESEMVKDLSARASKITPQKCAVSTIQLSQYLWDQTSTQQHQALSTKFIQGIRHGSLDPTDFGAYMVQDSVWCYKMKGSVDIAAEKVSDPVLKSFLEDQSDSFKKLYEEFFASWRIRNPCGIDLNDACADYLKIVQNVAENMDALYFLVSLIPAAKLWSWLGQQISLTQNNFGVYESWVTANLNPNDNGYEILELIINSGFILGLIDKDRALEIYKGCMIGEVQFFSSVTP